jgi:hypothetical protein
MTIRRNADTANTATSRAASLGPTQCQHLAAVVAELRPEWSVELHHDVLGKPVIVILPDDLNDPIDPTLSVHRDDAAFHLEELSGDTYRKLGKHRGWDDVLRAVRIRLIWDTQLPTQVHGSAVQVGGLYVH